MSVKSSTELMLYVVLTMPTLNKAYLLFMFGSSCLYEGSCLIYFILYLFTHSGAQHIMCWVFLLGFSSSYAPGVSVSLDCTF
jgi:hypothetical protein